MKRVTILVLAVALAACATIYGKKPFPIDGEKAKLTIEIPDLKDGGFHLQPRNARVDTFSTDKGCPWEEGDIQTYNETYLFTTMYSWGESKQVVDIPVGKEVFFLMNDIYAQKCPQTARFKPEPNREYILTIDANDGGLHPCSAKIEEIKDGKKTPVKDARYAVPKNIFWGAFSYYDVCD